MEQVCFNVQKRTNVSVPYIKFHLLKATWQKKKKAIVKKHGKRQSPISRCKLHFDWLLISSEGCFVWFLFWVNELNQSHWSCGSKLSVLCFCLSGDQRDSIRTSLTLSRGQSSVRAEGFTTILSHAKISASINKTEELFLQSAAHFARITLFINIEGGHQPPLDHVQIHVII